jgi:hypothetical protein
MGRVADLVDVVGANALLDIHQQRPARVRLAEEIGHQRLHARADKQRRRIVHGDHRR